MDNGNSRLSRRHLMQASAGAVVLTAAEGAAAQPAAPTRAIRMGEPNPFYDYSPMRGRAKLKWPNGARVAVHIVPNIEHWDVHDDKGHMDVRNNPRNDYGLRVAVWRLFDIFSERNIPTTIALNASVCRFYPQIIEAAKARGDEFMGHGMTNSEHLDLVPSASAASIVRAAVETISASTGQRVRGWLGPGLGEADGTLDALKAAGIEYVCDWGAADDQPFPMKNGLYAVPYTLDINDIGLIDRQGTPASVFAQYIVDAFDTLYREGEDQGRVLPIALHPYLIGAPHRVGHLVKALDYIRGHSNVWFARGGDILDAYKAAMAR
jgi:allantoinase